MPMLPVNEANKGIALAEPTVKEHDVDVLIVGGGMGACGAAYEAARWGKDNGVTNIMLCDKAALERSGAVAQGLSAINTYIGNDNNNKKQLER
jgi:adenylylsulfate reductase subunit A